METLINNSLQLDYEIFYTLTLKKEFTDEYKNIFNYNLDSIDKLKESFDFENFSFENFYRLLKLFDECDTQRKNFRTLTLKFMRDRHSLDKLIKEDENLILNKLKIHTEMKEKIIEHQYNKLIEFSNENVILRKELEKIKKEFYAVKSNLQSNNPNSKAANANLISKKSLVNYNTHLNCLNNASNVNNTKSKILKKTKTPTKISTTVNKTNNLVNNTNNNNIKDMSQSNANSSTASKNSINNNKYAEMLNATFCASKAGLNNDNNNNTASNDCNSNVNMNTERNTFINKNESINSSNINNQYPLGSSKKPEFKSNSKITRNYRIHRKNNSLCDKSLDSHLLVGSPSSNLNISAECAASPHNKQIRKLNTLNQNNPTKTSSMNITMKVNNINNFNNSIQANIISNSAGSVNKDFLDAHSNNLINYSNLNTNSNLLNDSFNTNENNNNNNYSTNENLLKKIMNFDFLGEKCNIISNSPINSPKIKFSSIEQTESSVNNFSGGSSHVNSNDFNKKINNVKMNSINGSYIINHPKTSYKPVENNVKNNGSYDDKDPNNNINNFKCSTKFNFKENSDQKIMRRGEIDYENINSINLTSNLEEKTLFGPECLSSNSTYSQSEQLNRNNQINRKQKGLKNLDNIEISNDEMITNLRKTSDSNNFKTNNNTNKNNNINDSRNLDKKIRENSHDTSGCSDNKNSPCFMRESSSTQNPLANSNCFGYTHTFNEYQSNSNENGFADVKRKINYGQLNENEISVKKNFNFFESNNNTQDTFFEDEKPKDLEYAKTERYSSSIPRKRFLQGNNLLAKFDENFEEKKDPNVPSVMTNKPRTTADLQIKKPNIVTKVKSKKNYLDSESMSNPNNSVINGNIVKNNHNNNEIKKKSLTPRKNNLTQKNSFNNSNSIAGSLNNNSNMQKQKLSSGNSPTKLKKGHSNSIDFDHKNMSAIDKLSSSCNQYQSNFANYNTSIKKRKQKSDLYESEKLNTHASWAKPKLDISDITYQNTLNKSDLYDYAPDAERFDTHTSRGLGNPKKLIFVEKISDKNSNKKENSYLNLDSNKINPEKNLKENINRLEHNEDKKVNVIKIDNKNTRNNALINHCNISSSFNEETSRNPNDNLSEFSTLLNCSVKNEKKKNTKPTNNSISKCNPNFKESKLAMELLNKSNKTSSNDSSSGKAAGYAGFSRNNAISNNNFNSRLNATLNSITELKKKMNL